MKQKRNKGITLVALVITIILLLILAGVTISLILNGGMIDKAQISTKEYDKQAYQEKLILKIAEHQADKLEQEHRNIVLEELQVKLGEDSEIAQANLTKEKNILQVQFYGKNYFYLIDENLNIIEIRDTIFLEYAYNNPIVPQGFKKVETEASWKPNEEGFPSGWNDGLVIEDEHKNQFVWIPVKDGVGIDGEYLSEEADKIAYKRWCPSVKYANYTYAKGNYLPDSVEEETAQILKYGGFYIARYEAGVGQNNTPVSQKNTSVWVNISPVNAKTASEKMYSNDKVQSGLMTGTQVDTIFRWLVISGISIDNPVTWGNQHGAAAPASTVSGYGAYQKTGYSELWKAKNIYDLAGNYIEITSEYDNNGNYATRGGIMQSDGGGSIFDRSYRISNNAESVIGFRVALFLK